MRKKTSSCGAFSLVEVVVALGVVVFCLLTILGLLAEGVNTTHVSTTQTVATNLLNAVAADIEATPNLTASYPPASARGAVAKTSIVYGITLPATGTAAATTPTTIYLGDDGQVTNAAAALYQLNVWTAGATSTRQETVVRLMISWPASVSYLGAQGYVENVVAMNRE